MKTVTFHHAGQETNVRANVGEDLLSLARRAGVIIESPCNGSGTCGKCKVKIVSPQKEEEIVLACHTTAQEDLTVEIIERHDSDNLQIKQEGLASAIEIDSIITKQYLADQDVTEVYRKQEWIATEQGNTEKEIYGLSIDIGTTTLVVSLVNLLIGKELSATGALNPQSRLGQDVLSRIRYASKEQGLLEMNQLLIEELNKMILEVITEAGVSLDHVYELVLSGNTCMLHLAVKADPKELGKYPYTPMVRGGNSIVANDLGIYASPSAEAYLAPIISAYVGGDITSGILVSRLPQRKDTSLFIDIGTNGEIVLATDGKLAVTSTAAGPAFEGMNISCGMRAAPGAVEGFSLTTDGERKLKNIGDQKAVGICGSGLLDIVAAMVQNGVIEGNGKFSKSMNENLSALLTQVNGKPVFSIAEEVYLSQPDIRQVQLAKGAIRAGIEALLAYQSITVADVDRVLIAGSFGYHLNPDSLIAIGLLPEAFRDKIEFLGNTSKTGGQAFLLNQQSRLDISQTIDEIGVLELATVENFDRLFVECLKF